MKTNIRSTTLDAYFYINGNGVSLNQKGKILEGILLAKKPLSRTEISERTGIRINAVCGRVNELIRDGYLRETRNKNYCSITHRNVFSVYPTGKV